MILRDIKDKAKNLKRKMKNYNLKFKTSFLVFGF